MKKREKITKLNINKMKINKCKNETQKCNKEMRLHRIVNVCFLCGVLKLSLVLLCAHCVHDENICYIKLIHHTIYHTMY